MKSQISTNDEKKTSLLDKLLVSIINLLVVLIPTAPFFWIGGWRWVLVGTFLIYQLIIALTKTGQSIGMRLLKIKWNKKYPLNNRLIFAILYTASFATIAIWVFFPFDLLLFNLICIQLPTVLITGSTLHAYLAGKMYGIKEGRKKEAI